MDYDQDRQAPEGADMKTGTLLAITLFSLVAIAHLLRLIFDVPLTAGSWQVPPWASVLGVCVPAWIAWLLWRERR
ncbi:MAG: hypothetical protein GTN86_10145 [Xanthomonadales bacterium]|nr:hypothetical protein [Xanthomonadales bacterium]NIN60189.1 hypothetical protein [Xanthomonadales bacterium]NIN75555.1 hypothetical protein [Xanthomonadales bacterium]NIO12846.1 hypothetical protein [Xanthomonadales bacterium]NIP12582.1 hypothetical protein [Xanthomonadales bacterium]